MKTKKMFLLVAAAAGVYICSCATSPAFERETQVQDTIRLVFVGDVMGHGLQISGALHDGGDTAYNYRPVFQWVKDYISSADIAFANLEVTLAGAPYTGYPCFSSHDTLADALMDAGFDVMVTANNHSLDRGRQGLERTIDVLESRGLVCTGTFKDSADLRRRHPLIVEHGGFRLALLNYTYGTNGFKVEAPNVINRIDTLRMLADLQAAQGLNPDCIIAFMHWGTEYANTENESQRRIARMLAREGCGIIAGAHPHVVQPFAWLPVAGDSVPVIYSMGNFVSNQRDRYRNGGIAIELELVRRDSTTRVASCSYEPFWVYRPRTDKGSVFRLIPVSHYALHPEVYNIDTVSHALLTRFSDDTRALLSLPVGHWFEKQDSVPPVPQ